MNTDKWGKALAGTRANNTQRKGALIMKTVSLLLASSRRVSNQAKHSSDKEGSGGDDKNKKRKVKAKRMDEAAGKLNPKLLESLKKRTHFNK